MALQSNPTQARSTRCSWLLAFLFCFAPSHGEVHAQQSVNLELAMLIDVSASVNAEEYRLQARGLANAFRNELVQHAIHLAKGGIAVSIIQWADHHHQQRAIDWTRLETPEDANAFSNRLAAMPRLIAGGHTAVGSALAFAVRDMQTNGYVARRQVIDLSGDGRTNDGLPLRPTREMVLSHGITINGLAIINELPLLASYFRKRLIGGDGAFLIIAQNYSDFASAMVEKLEREIRNATLAGRAREHHSRMAVWRSAN